jgi:Na+/H+ antiporter NhaD/arsenite permease-like protein
MSLLMCVPFVGLILSIALLPLIVPKLWHKHYGKIAFGWLVAGAWSIGHFLSPETAVRSISHALVEEYAPFVCIVFALYTISGGLRVHVHANPTPLLNTILLFLGAIFANLVGTAGATMILIRPFLKLNHHRANRTHQVIFFIFAVSNIGGTLTPLGDPPLFLGFLKGVDFFWTAQHLWAPYIVTLGLLLAIFYVVDRMQCEDSFKTQPADHKINVSIDGKMHFLLLLGVIGLVLQSGIWKPEEYFNVLGIEVGTQNMVRDVGMVLLAALSVLMTPMKIRRGHEFHWEPFLEVSKLFLAIFITLIPVVGIMQQWGAQLATPLSASEYFWFTGGLSAFLDNAPTYLVFFSLAGGNPIEMMTLKAGLLVAISLGSVFMGALTYIGNAPNFMVATIARNYQVRMPSFFGYMIWSCGILLPIFLLINWLFVGG